ncbi:hypothetical protein Gotur_035050 [Gossypium turneri]
MANIGRGCKLDPKLISVFIERWRPEKHTFHISCGECTITLEDMQLQLRLPVDGSLLTGSVQSTDWGAICYDLLSAIPDNIYGGRIEMGWSRYTFSEPINDSTEVAILYREMCGATPPNKAKIGGSLSLLQSWAWFNFLFLRPRVKHPYTFSLITRWKHSASHVGLPTALEDIRLILDQRSEAHTPYEDPTIWQ